MVRRGIAPRLGKISLPGGFIVIGESWRTAGARETFEEAQTVIPSPDESIYEYMVESIPNTTQIILFGLVRKDAKIDVKEFTPTEEATERLVIRRHNFDLYKDEIAFPLHLLAIQKYFNLKT
jgi:ADP-ribose pyrophosphatase YjhB (NUDIX family)